MLEPCPVPVSRKNSPPMKISPQITQINTDYKKYKKISVICIICGHLFCRNS